MFETAQWLTNRGHDVSVRATPLTFGPRVEKPAAHMLNTPYSESWRHDIKADVAYIYYYAPLVWRMFFNTYCPTVAGLHAPGLLSPKSLRHHLFRFLGSQDLAPFDAVRVVNPGVFKFNHPWPAHIPDSVNTQRFRPHKGKPDRFTVLFVGRSHVGKGRGTFVEVATDVCRDGYPIEFKATGSSEGVVHGVGTVDHKDMPTLFSQTHALVYPAWEDTFGIVMLEALACGIPVITTPTYAHMNLGLPLVFASSVQAFKARVLNLYGEWIDNPSWAEKVGPPLRESTLPYDTEVVFARFERLLMAVATKNASAWRDGT